MSDRMEALAKLSNEVKTPGSCPQCGSLRNCAIEDGKSSSACWCMSAVVNAPSINLTEYDTCFCKGCLVNEDCR